MSLFPGSLSSCLVPSIILSLSKAFETCVNHPTLQSMLPPDTNALTDNELDGWSFGIPDRISVDKVTQSCWQPRVDPTIGARDACVVQNGQHYQHGITLWTRTAPTVGDRHSLLRHAQTLDVAHVNFCPHARGDQHQSNVMKMCWCSGVSTTSRAGAGAGALWRCGLTTTVTAAALSSRALRMPAIGNSNKHRWFIFSDRDECDCYQKRHLICVESTVSASTFVFLVDFACTEMPSCSQDLRRGSGWLRRAPWTP